MMLYLVGHWSVFLIVVDDPQQPRTIVVFLEDFQLQV